MVHKRSYGSDARVVAIDPMPSGGAWVGPSRSIYRPGNLASATFTLGRRTSQFLPVSEPSYRISELVSRTGRAPPPSLPPPIDRRDIPPNQGILPVTDWRLSRFYVAGITEAGVEYMERKARERTPILAPPILPPAGETKMIHDTIGEIAGDWLRYKFAPQPQVPQPQYLQQPGQPFPAFNQTNVLGLPFVDVIPEAQNGCAHMVWDPRRNCGQGGWIKKSKRRRKRLATKGDIADLAALIGILGNGKNLVTWIATH